LVGETYFGRSDDVGTQCQWSGCGAHVQQNGSQSAAAEWDPDSRRLPLSRACSLQLEAARCAEIHFRRSFLADCRDQHGRLFQDSSAPMVSWSAMLSGGSLPLGRGGRSTGGVRQPDRAAAAAAAPQRPGSTRPAVGEHRAADSGWVGPMFLVHGRRPPTASLSRRMMADPAARAGAPIGILRGCSGHGQC
jgi:hypothetical protein